MSLIAVDDDPIVRKGIVDSISWDEHGFHVVGEAANGREAFTLVKDLLPDIVITDIKMPVEDGLSLSQNIARSFPKTRIIILSGYEDFDYARQAIKIGVTNYLVKPVQADELLSHVQNVADKIERERMSICEENIKNSMIKENLSQIRTRFLNNLVNGMIGSESEIIRTCKLLDIHIDRPSYQLLIIDSDEGPKSKFPGTVTVFDLVEKVFSNECGVISFCNEQGSVVTILNTDGEYIQHINCLLGKLKDEIRRETEAPVDFFLGGMKEGLEGIPQSYQEALLKLKNKINNCANRHQYKKIVARAVSFIEENYQNKISIEDVVKCLYVSSGYFSKIFKAETGIGFVDYLNRYRVEKAKEMMVLPGLKIYEIAEKVGYPDYKYFNYIFNKYMGYSPKKHYNECI